MYPARSADFRGVKTKEVLEALRVRHSAEKGWVTLEEFDRIDLMAFACHGHYDDRRTERQQLDAIHPWVGYEVKVSRSDFRCEIRKPSKRAWGVAITNEFYFCAPAGLIKPGEVPEDCGLVEVTRAGTRTAVKAPLTAAQPLGQLRLSQMLRHGINPSRVQYVDERVHRERWKKRAAESAAARAAEELEVALETLGGIGRQVVEVGSRWMDRRNRRVVVVCEVTALSVVYVDTDPEARRFANHYSFSPLCPVSTFLMNFRPASEAETIAA